MLIRLLYASRAAGDIDAHVVRDILDQSRQNNPDAGITGVLCVCPGGVYLQALEGGRDRLNQLYAKILKDPRHKEVTILAYDEITQRKFPSWSMGKVELAKVNAAVVLKYSETPSFDPLSISGEAALCLIDELMEAAAIVGTG
ncbi:MAG: BLUF domain-containing protein [Acidobacteriota bacterium]